MSWPAKILIAVCFAGMQVPMTALADKADSASNPGQKVYKESCKSCHGGGIGGWFSGAPKTGDKKVWAALIAKGVPALLESSLNGIGDMQPRGGCETCSDDDIAAAVEYMVSQSR